MAIEFWVKTIYFFFIVVIFLISDYLSLKTVFLVLMLFSIHKLLGILVS